MSATRQSSSFVPGLLLGIGVGIALTLVCLYFWLDVGRWSESMAQYTAESLTDEVVILERIRGEGAVGPLTALEERLDGAIVAVNNPIAQDSGTLTPETIRALKRAAEYRRRYPYKSTPELETEVANALSLAREAH